MSSMVVAYFSMEIAVDPGIPTYSGGLGILAGDAIRSAADLRVPMLAVTLLHRKGYFTQTFDASGWQQEREEPWGVATFLTEQPERVAVTIEERTVHLRAWRFDVVGVTGWTVPVYFLDADLPENSEWDRALTHYLYGGDARYRLCQEVVLGIGGVKMLRALGHHTIGRFHLNEGHASLLTLELLDEGARDNGRKSINAADIEAVKQKCIFTTHTPVPAGHDQFPMDLVGRVLGRQQGFLNTRDVFCAELVSRVLQRDNGSYDSNDIFRAEFTLNLTYLALNLSHYINGVAKRHAKVSQRMFSKYRIEEITNGVHAASWISPGFGALFDLHIPGWRADNFSLRYALGIPPQDIWKAHAAAKVAFLEYANRKAKAALDPETLTLGFARRATPYKRAELIFADIDRLQSIARQNGALQIIYAGKAHPNDSAGKEIIQRIRRLESTVNEGIRLVYLEDYGIELARLMTAGVDVWLNTPLPPMEASGTSGMKAAMNGVPSLSIMDGWWIEGCIEGVTGWSIGETPTEHEPNGDRTRRDAEAFYEKLALVVAPLYYRDRHRFIDVMRHAIALNGSFFNTQRMMQQYVLNAYFE